MVGEDMANNNMRTVPSVPGASLPVSRLYNLSWPEQEVMEKYLSESLAAGLVRPSSSLVGSLFRRRMVHCGPA